MLNVNFHIVEDNGISKVMRLYRYSYNEGEFGGVVLADSKENATERIVAAYRDIGGEYTDGNANYLPKGEILVDTLTVWAADDDDMGEIYKKYGVLDIY